MKVRKVILYCLAAAVGLAFVYEYGWAQADDAQKKGGIGIVSIRKIFNQCKRNVKYREEAVAEQDKVLAELDKLSKEIDADKAGLKVLKSGSEDHIKLMKEVLTKQANFQAQEEFAKQQFSLKDQRWTEQLYQDILRVTKEVAKAKGLDIVFGVEEPEIPAASANELMLSIRTHTVLYSGGCIDISDDVLAMIDSEK
jgi:Skp family chaperone for outer membrane proteins